MQTYHVSPTSASASNPTAPVVESPEQAHRRRLAASLQRWVRMRDYYRARGMRSELKRAERVIDQTRRALEDAGFLVS